MSAHQEVLCGIRVALSRMPAAETFEAVPVPVFPVSVATLGTRLGRVGAGHEHYLHAAPGSLEAQTLL